MKNEETERNETVKRPEENKEAKREAYADKPRRRPYRDFEQNPAMEGGYRGYPPYHRPYPRLGGKMYPRSYMPYEVGRDRDMPREGLREGSRDAPRDIPRDGLRDAPRDAGRYEGEREERPEGAPQRYDKYDTPRYDTPRHESPRYDTPRYEPSRYDTPRYDRMMYYPHMPMRHPSYYERVQRRRIPRPYSMHPDRMYDGGYRHGPAPESKILVVFGIPFSMAQEEVIDILKKRIGPDVEFEKIYIVPRKPGRTKLFAFINFQTKEDASEAKKRLEGLCLKDQELRVDYSITEKGYPKEDERENEKEDGQKEPAAS